MAYKTREDSWTTEDDNLLMSTVIDYIANGKTQLLAFEEVGDMLGRTSAAVGFRFNNALRHKCRDDLTRAKRKSKEAKKKAASPVVPVVEVVKEESKVELVLPKVEVEVEAPARAVKDLIPTNDFPTLDLSIYDSVSDILKKFGAIEKELREVKKENAELKAKYLK